MLKADSSPVLPDNSSAQRHIVVFSGRNKAAGKPWCRAKPAPGFFSRAGYQRPGIRQQRSPARRSADVAPLFFAEQMLPEDDTIGISHELDSQFRPAGP